MEYGRRVKASRVLHRVAQADLAKAAGIVPNTLVDIELGRLEISARQYREFVRLVRELATQDAAQATS